MGIFSRFKNKGNINLLKSDFKSESEDFEVLSVKVSGEFFEKFPQAKKKDNYVGESTLITNTAKLSLFGNKVDITYDPSEIELNEDKFIDQINRNLNWIAENESELKSRVTEKLLPLKNENWLDENEAELSENDFVKRIKLTSISFFGKGNSEMIFDDGDLFWGHEIVADLNVKNKLTDVNVRG
ncbi:DUF2262 domain-containing protein [Aquimarina celericrescens]|uniref:DUF2262 domain-containing protein n=1 Tax=Aquimarina celericrescens TaxID=1964542 RepID=A0ABW5B0F0_9FLAO|nr:DUF2262 domain-containing protein [Aquimarina celericrescens]